MSTKFKTFNSSKFGRPFEKSRATAEDVKAERADYEGQEIDNPNTRAFYMQNQPDGSDAYANKGFAIKFKNTITNEKVDFKAFITAYNETYNCDWAAEQVYGRADPIPMWKSTTRKITLAFKIPCFSVGEGYENLARLQTLIKSLYPSYSKMGEAQTIAQSPLIRIQLMNLLSDYGHGTSAGATLKDMQEGYSTSYFEEGVLGFIGNLTVNHNLEAPDAGILEVGNPNMAGANLQEGGAVGIVPKVIDVNLDFTALHEHPLGWTKVGNTWHFGTDEAGVYGQDEGFDARPEIGFPYGVDIDGMENPTFYDLKKAQNAAAQKYTEEQKKRQVQTQAEANAKARYSGLFGSVLQRKDERKAQAAHYEASVASNQQMMAQWDKEDKYESAASFASILGPQNQFIDLGDPYHGLTDDEIMDL